MSCAALISRRRRRSRTLPLLAVLAAAGLAGGLSPALGGSGGTLERQSTTLAQREHSALLDLYAAESSLARARETAASVQARQAALLLERRSVSRRATIVRTSLHAARTRVGQALRDLYIQGQPDPVAIFLGATSLDDAISAIDTVTRAGVQNRRLIAEMHRTEASLRSIDAALAQHGRELAAVRTQAQASVVRLQTAVAQQAGLLSSLQRQLDITRRAATRLEQQARAAQERSAKITTPPAVAVAATPVAATSTTIPTTTTPTAAPAPAAVAPQSGPRNLVVDAVAYHLPGRTASGLPVGVGVIAVDPRVIPLGTRVFVPGYGPAVAADTGSAIIGNIIDLWMPTTAQARAWGRRTVTITIYG